MAMFTCRNVIMALPLRVFIWWT